MDSAIKVLSIFTGLITIIEVIRGVIEFGKYRKRKKSMEEISNQLRELKPLMNLEEKLKELSQQERSQTERLIAYSPALLDWSIYGSLIEKTNLFPIINEAYKAFLQNEEKFSMSYGYGRYIDAFRKIINMEEDYIRAKDLDDAVEKEKVFKAVYDEAIRLKPYIREIQYKFDKGEKKDKK